MNPLVAQGVCSAEPAGHRVFVAWMIRPWVARGCAGNSTRGTASVFAQTLRRVLGPLSRKGSGSLNFSRGMLNFSRGMLAFSRGMEEPKREMPRKKHSATRVSISWAVVSWALISWALISITALKSALKEAKRISKISVPVSGCPTWIRTMTNRFRDCCATITQSGSQNRSGDRTRNFL